MPGRWRDPRLALGLLTTLNLLVASWWLAVTTRIVRVPSSLTPALVLLIPLVGLTVWWLRRNSHKPLRAYAWFSAAFLALSWVPIAGMMTVYALIAEPWPLSLRQGPDTTAAREGYRLAFGSEPPASVTGLYAHMQWEGPGEHVTFIAFDYTDDEVVRAIVDKFALRPVPAGEIPQLRAVAGPAWFPSAPTLQQCREAHRQARPDHPDVFVHLWVDRARRRVYFQDVDTG